VFLGEILSVEHLVIFPKEQCAFGDYPTWNRRRTGFGNALHKHIAKHIYRRHIKQAKRRTRLPTMLQWAVSHFSAEGTGACFLW